MRFLGKWTTPLRKRLSDRSGTTLVELLASLLLMGIAISMAVVILHGAYRIYQRIQRTQDAYSLVDTIGTELQGIVEDANGYVKLYADADAISGEKGTDGRSAGTETLEFLDANGYAVLMTAEGCSETALYTGNDPTDSAASKGSFEAVPAGQLVVRYYNRQNDGSYYYQKASGEKLARAAAKVYGEGFYMDYQVKVTFRLPEGTAASSGTKLGSLQAEVSVSEKNAQEPIASDTFVLEFRRELQYSDSITAKAYEENGM